MAHVRRLQEALKVIITRPWLESIHPVALGGPADRRVFANFRMGSARAPEAAILERLQRGDASRPVHPALATIDTDGPLDRAAAAVADLPIVQPTGP